MDEKIKQIIMALQESSVELKTLKNTSEASVWIMAQKELISDLEKAIDEKETFDQLVDQIY